MRLCENITAISNVKVSVLEVTDVILDTYMRESQKVNFIVCGFGNSPFSLITENYVGL